MKEKTPSIFSLVSEDDDYFEDEHEETNDSPYSDFSDPKQFVISLNEFLPSGVTASLAKEVEATPYQGAGFVVEVEDDQSSDRLNKTFEMCFNYESGLDEIQVAAIFKPYRDTNIVQTWISRDETWNEFGEDLVSKIWGK